MFPISPAMIKVAGLAIAILAVFFVGVRWERSGWLEKQIEAQKQIAELSTQNAAISAQYEKSRSNQRVTQRTIELEINNEIKNNPNNYSCVIPDGMRELINRSVNSSNSAK
jgi:hypothetical protein